MMNVKAGDVLTVASTIDPQTVANTAKVGDYVDMADYDQVMFVFETGDMAAETIDCAVYEATDSSGTGAQSLRAATQLAAHATNNDNSQVVIVVRADELTDGFRYVAPRMVTGGATGGVASAVGIGIALRAGLPTDNDLATVKEIKQV